MNESDTWNWDISQVNDLHSMTWCGLWDENVNCKEKRREKRESFVLFLNLCLRWTGAIECVLCSVFQFHWKCYLTIWGATMLTIENRRFEESVNTAEKDKTNVSWIWVIDRKKRVMFLGWLHTFFPHWVQSIGHRRWERKREESQSQWGQSTLWLELQDDYEKGEEMKRGAEKVACVDSWADGQESGDKWLMLLWILAILNFDVCTSREVCILLFEFSAYKYEDTNGVKWLKPPDTLSWLPERGKMQRWCQAIGRERPPEEQDQVAPS